MNRAKFRNAESQRKILRRSLLLPFLLLAVASVTNARSLDLSVIGMFPKDVEEFGCADLTQARQFPWFPQLKSQLVPVSLYDFEQFLEAAEMRQTSPIDEIAWAIITAPGGDPSHTRSGIGEVVAVATGEFDADTIQSFLNSRKIRSVQLGNYILYDPGTGVGASDIFFTVLDGKTIAFGPLEQLKQILNIRDKEEPNLTDNEKMMALIDKANGDGVFWAVLDPTRAAMAIGQLVPEAANFPQSSHQIGRVQELLITVTASNNIEIDLQAAFASRENTSVVSQLLQAGVLLQCYQTDAEKNPELAKLLGSVRITAHDNEIDVSVDLTNEELVSLIEHNTFAGKI